MSIADTLSDAVTDLDERLEIDAADPQFTPEDRGMILALRDQMDNVRAVLDAHSLEAPRIRAEQVRRMVAERAGALELGRPL